MDKQTKRYAIACVDKDSKMYFVDDQKGVEKLLLYAARLTKNVYIPYFTKSVAVRKVKTLNESIKHLHFFTIEMKKAA